MILMTVFKPKTLKTRFPFNGTTSAQSKDPEDQSDGFLDNFGVFDDDIEGIPDFELADVETSDRDSGFFDDTNIGSLNTGLSRGTTSN
jgi:hypothetical protein